MYRSILLVAFLLLFSTSSLPAQGLPSVITEAVKKVVRAIDLRIQRLQNQTIWLQNAQKEVENVLSKLRLDEISDWVERQRELYRDYFDELSRVKSVITYYHRIRDIIDQQRRLVQEYRRAYQLFRQDGHFTFDEVTYMGKVYTGMLEKSVQHLEQLFNVVESFTTTMTDAERLVIINKAGDDLQGVYRDLKVFNRQNMLLSLQRAKDQQDIQVTKKLYGL